MKNKTLLFISTIIILISFSSCDDWKIDFKESERRGNLIINATKKYHKEKGEYPSSLDSLVPKYLNEIPKVKMFIGKDRDFKYNLYGVIPYSGCFIIEFMYKPDGFHWEYDSRTDKFAQGGQKTINPDYIEESITFEDIKLIKNSINSYYKDSMKYPLKLNELIPTYMDSFPYDTAAKYRPYDIAPKFSSDLLEYKFYQPSDTFRGEFVLYFDVTFGTYENYNAGSWFYND